MVINNIKSSHDTDYRQLVSLWNPPNKADDNLI